MTTIDIEKPAELGRAKRLKAATHEMHERLDKAIMASEPFASRERYGLFVKMQHQFHRDIDAFYADPALERLLPGLPHRRRLGLIEQDLADLGIAAVEVGAEPMFGHGEVADIPAALGWLYVAEGSNLGAAFLLKDAVQLGFSESFGARHLAPSPEGRGLHWRTFTAALDAVDLDDEQDAAVLRGANAAFAHVHGLVREIFG